MGHGEFVKANRTITAKWLVRNEDKLMFNLSIQRSEVWDLERKSLFVHSLIYGYPVPNFYAQDTGDDKLWMLDGKQRFTTAIQYQKGEFVLSEKTPFVGDIKIAGYKFEDLPQEFQEAIRDYNFTIFTFKNLDEESRDEMFLRLNHGAPLTKIELTRVMASSKIMDFVREISNKPFFKNSISLSDSMRNRFVDEELILQVISVIMHGDNKSLGSKEIKELAIELKENGISEPLKNLMRDITDYLGEAIPEKEIKLKKVHIPIVFNTAITAKSDGIEPSKFGGFVQYFLNSYKSGDSYGVACFSGSADRENVKKRLNAMMESYKENINDVSEYKAPEPKVSGKRGRRKIERTEVNSNQPPVNDQLTLVASGSNTNGTMLN